MNFAGVQDLQRDGWRGKGHPDVQRDPGAATLSAKPILVPTGGTKGGVRRLLRPHPGWPHLQGVQGSRGGVRT